MTNDDTFILIYSEDYRQLVDSLPSSYMSIEVDAEVASTFRVSKIPVLIQYEGTKEVKRYYGTQTIQEHVHG
jgi:spore coat protein CotH